LEEPLGQEVALEQLFGAMSSIVPEVFVELEEKPQCLIFDKHLTDRKHIKRILIEALSPYFKEQYLHQVAHILAIEIKVALSSGIFNIDAELDLIFKEMLGKITISPQKEKVIRVVCQTILSCSELK
jgi:hypothetical protein